ncbi:Protein Hook 1 [Manis pentadactyla]|nr:Protein Hook 1 [Manis pentadactyla]
MNKAKLACKLQKSSELFSYIYKIIHFYTLCHIKQFDYLILKPQSVSKVLTKFAISVSHFFCCFSQLIVYWKNHFTARIKLATSDKANKLESTVEIYRQKLQDLNDLRKQVKTLQDTNMMYMHNTVSLEEELKKANAARTQLETYKKQVRKYFVKLIKLKEPNFSIPFDTFRMI